MLKTGIKEHHTCPVSLDTTQITKEAGIKPFAHVSNDISTSHVPHIVVTNLDARSNNRNAGSLRGSSAILTDAPHELKQQVG